MNIGKGIVDVCMIRGISQQELAAKTGLSITYHSLLENNHRNPSMATLNSIAKSLNVPIFVIFFYSMEDSDFKSTDPYFKHKGKIFNIINEIFLYR